MWLVRRQNRGRGEFARNLKLPSGFCFPLGHIAKAGGTRKGRILFSSAVCVFIVGLTTQTAYVLLCFRLAVAKKKSVAVDSATDLSCRAISDCRCYPLRASAPLTISISSFVMDDWRALLYFRRRSRRISVALSDALVMEIIRAPCSEATESHSAL